MHIARKPHRLASAMRCLHQSHQVALGQAQGKLSRPVALKVKRGSASSEGLGGIKKAARRCLFCARRSARVLALLLRSGAHFKIVPGLRNVFRDV